MDYSAANVGLWNVIIQLGMIAAAILISHFLCRKIRFIQGLMMPVAVLAGFMLLAAKYLGAPLDNSVLEILVYHGIALGFIAMSLRVPTSQGKDENLTGLRSGAIIVSTYLVQGAVGLLVTLALSHTLMPGLFQAAGLLLPMGYGQGPGQANNVGSTYEALGFAGGRSFGMAIAAAGYLVACIAGVVILNVLKRQGKIRKDAAAPASRSAKTGDDYFDGSQASDFSSSVDILSVQVGLTLVTYFITFLVIAVVTGALAQVAPGAAGTLSPLIWGFNFIVGSILAILVRILLGKIRGTDKKSRPYQNNYLLNRISGFFFDIMIVAGIASIEIEDIRGLWLPFILLAVLGGIATWFHLALVCKAVYKDYYYQGLISMFGMMTGTISSGILLLREIDPEFDTPAANNLVTGSGFGIVFGAPILILVSLAARSEAMTWTTLGIDFVYLAVLLLFIYKLRGRSRKKA